MSGAHITYDVYHFGTPISACHLMRVTYATGGEGAPNAAAMMSRLDGRSAKGWRKQADPAGRWSAPALMLAAFVALLPVQFAFGDSLNIAPSDLLILMYLALRLPRLRRVHAAWSSWHLALLGLLGYGVLVTLSKTGTISQLALVRKGVGLLVLLATYACLVDFFRNWSRIRWLLRIFLVAVIVNTGVAVVAMVVVDLGGPAIPLVNAPWPGLRLSGLYLDANAFGGLIALALILHQMTYRSVRPLLTGGWAWAANLALPIGLVLTFSRSSWLGLITGIFVAALLRPAVAARALVRTVAPLLVLAPIALVKVVPDATDLVTRPSQIESRATIGADAIREFLHSPLIGMGLGEYSTKYDIIVHNTLLWFLAEFGIAGLVVIAGFLASFVVKLSSVARLGPVDQRSLIFALLAGHAVMFGVSVGIEALYQRHWWLVMAAAGAAYALGSTTPGARSRTERVVDRLPADSVIVLEVKEPHRIAIPVQAARYSARL